MKSKEISKAHKTFGNVLASPMSDLCQSHSSIIRLNKPTVYNLPSYIINQCCEWLLPGIHLNYTYTRYHLIHSTYPIVSQGCGLTPVRERNIQRVSEREGEHF